ncbi:hypothetical protein [Treponema sp. OMZ 857]|uniref:hypothetical protein n=1 Tax=Treponema sp. OMZ 857 TaxID=1643513 RepID=UPI0020A51CC6|nr:hypothetical protein [Treponema sp. OMZ 857]UTC44083.1 hypothetical protein E4N66_08370 [Treponema sp. OMZ 857]
MSNKMICLEEEANVAVKHVFRAELLNAIAKNDKGAFKTLVEQIGKDWHVSRTVETEEKEEFREDLWKNKEAILSNKYEWNKSQYSAYSYESKICFLLNPVYYKLIYDERNKKALTEFYKSIHDTRKVDKETWQETVEHYYSTLSFSPKDETDIDGIFRKDFELWAKDTVKTWIVKENGHITYKRGLTLKSAQELSV